MDQQEKGMIESLFERLHRAESQSGARDVQAETFIGDLVHQQPAAPYYMAQTILVQEYALRNLNARIQDLEQALAQRPAGGGFLAGLFGRETPPTVQTQPQAPLHGASAFAAPFSAGQGSFLGSALQTAAAVAGGVLLGNALAGLFGDENAAESPSATEESSEDEGFGDSGEEEI
jgi:hypothetical protein